MKRDSKFKDQKTEFCSDVPTSQRYQRIPNKSFGEMEKGKLKFMKIPDIVKIVLRRRTK